ncbi:MAG: hypothetical protein KDK91_02105 [Gammaproteobacteria bacterium]|nr:hypothetical protein [Gammaproteobacteria bacterium]
MTRPSTLAKTTPPSCEDVVARERLFELLDQKRRAPVVWVDGPPGSGKTTLLASYVAARGMTALWYQIDRGDSDLASFYYVLADAPRAETKATDESPDERGVATGLPLFTSEYHADAPAFARSFFQALFDQLGASFALVLDNYHELTPRSGVHEALREAAQMLPPGCNLIVGSRGPPPPALVRMRANRQVELIGWADLKLSPDESGSIASRWHPSLDLTMLARLYQVTEGWAAALVLTLEQQMADGLWLTAPSGAPEDLQDDLPDDLGIAAKPQLVFDYLAGELLDGLPEPLTDLLLKTAFLPDITAPMAGELTGIVQASELLAQLHRTNQLISVKRGSDGARYQCHPLLQEFLRQRARAVLGETNCQALQRASANLLEAENRITEAAALYAEIGDLESVQDLVISHAATVLAQGRAETVEAWIGLLPGAAQLLHEAWQPDQVVAQRWPYSPWSIFWLATCRLQRAPGDARRLYELALAAFELRQPDDRRGRLLTCSAAMDAIIYELDDLSQLERWIAVVDSELERDPHIDDAETRARLSVSMLIALVFRRPQAASIASWAERALLETQSIDDTNVRMSAQLLVAINLNYTGQFSRVRRFIDELQAMCERPHVSPLVLTTLKAVESMYFMLTADHERCSRAVEAGIEIGRHSGVHVWSFHLLSNGVAGALGAGDLAAADELLLKMGEFAASARRLDRAGLHYFQAWRAALDGRTELALEAQQRALSLSSEVGCPFYEALCRVAMADLMAGVGDRRAVFRHLRLARRIMRPVQNKWFEFMGFMVFASICEQLGRRRLMMLALRHALAIGRELGFRHFLWWQPAHVSRLCAVALTEGLERDFVCELIQQRRLAPPPMPPSDWPWPIRVRTLGGFQIERDGETLRVNRAQKPMLLLQLLIAMGGRDVPEQALAAALWPNVDASYARNSLNTNLSRLRKLLGDDQVVSITGGLIQLDTKRCWVDSLALTEVFERVDGLLGAGPVEDLSGWNRLEAAAARIGDLYQGAFLAGSGLDLAVVEARREALRDALIVSVLGLAAEIERSGNVDQACALLRRGLIVEPLAEPICIALVELLLRHGRARAAAGPLRDHVRALRSAGVQARSALMDALYARVIEQTDLIRE